MNPNPFFLLFKWILSGIITAVFITKARWQMTLGGKQIPICVCCIGEHCPSTAGMLWCDRGHQKCKKLHVFLSFNGTDADRLVVVGGGDTRPDHVKEPLCLCHVRVCTAANTLYCGECFCTNASEAEDRGNDASLSFVFDNARMDYAQKPWVIQFPPGKA